MIILDTNVVSELAKGPDRAAPSVLNWFRRLDQELLYVTTVALAELWDGVSTLPDGKRKRELVDTLESIVADIFAERVLSFDEDAARAYAIVRLARRRVGLAVQAMDMQMASIAYVKDMHVATRDIGDFEQCGVALINPWSADS